LLIISIIGFGSFGFKIVLWAHPLIIVEVRF